MKSNITALLLFTVFISPMSCTKTVKQNPPKQFLQAEMCGNYLDDGLCTVGEFSKAMESLGNNSGSWSKLSDDTWIYKIKMNNEMTNKNLKLSISIKVDKQAAVVNNLAIDDQMVNAFGLTSNIYPFITVAGKITKKSDTEIAAHKIKLKKRREEEVRQKKEEDDRYWKESEKQVTQQQLEMRVGNKKILRSSGKETFPLSLKSFDQYYRTDARPISWSEQLGQIVFSTEFNTGQKIAYFFKEVLYPESATRNGYALKLEKVVFDGKDLPLEKGFQLIQMAADESSEKSRGNAH